MNVLKGLTAAILTRTVQIPKVPTTVNVRMVLMEMVITVQVRICMFGMYILMVLQSAERYVKASFIKVVTYRKRIKNIDLPHSNFMFGNRLKYSIFYMIDINECVEGSDSCHSDANCTNTKGSYNCECKNGFNGNGYNCTGSYLYVWYVYSHVITKR